MSAGTTTPESALQALAARVAAEGEPLSAAATGGPPPEPALGLFAATGPRTAADPGSYALVVEAVREGYLCHHGTPRLLDSADPDLLLLAGDLFYAIGIARLAILEDAESVLLLSDLIRASAELHATGRVESVPSLWLAQISALAFGSDLNLAALIQALRRGDQGAERALDDWSQALAERSGTGGRIGEVRDVLHFGSPV